MFCDAGSRVCSLGMESAGQGSKRFRGLALGVYRLRRDSGIGSSGIGGPLQKGTCNTRRFLMDGLFL